MENTKLKIKNRIKELKDILIKKGFINLDSLIKTDEEFILMVLDIEIKRLSK